MLRKENRNPNPKQTAKPTPSHSTTPDCSSRPNYKPKYIKKPITIKEELHSETYLNSPASLMQSVIGMEPFAASRPKQREGSLEVERELRERTVKFNASILSFQQILIGINQVICDETIPGRVRLTSANDRINDLLNVFQEFSLE
jgi:hypothetical protein